LLRLARNDAGVSRSKLAMGGAPLCRAHVKPFSMRDAVTQMATDCGNQSLVILFSYGSKNLLFAGDAQWGNRENFLYGGSMARRAIPS
jgi:hypothetical protein